MLVQSCVSFLYSTISSYFSLLFLIFLQQSNNVCEKKSSLVLKKTTQFLCSSKEKGKTRFGTLTNYTVSTTTLPVNWKIVVNQAKPTQIVEKLCLAGCLVAFLKTFFITFRRLVSSHHRHCWKPHIFLKRVWRLRSIFLQLV